MVNAQQGITSYYETLLARFVEGRKFVLVVCGLSFVYLETKHNRAEHT